jgi:hypothetical protein
MDEIVNPIFVEYGHAGEAYADILMGTFADEHEAVHEHAKGRAENLPGGSYENQFDTEGSLLAAIEKAVEAHGTTHVFLDDGGCVEVRDFMADIEA